MPCSENRDAFLTELFACHQTILRTPSKRSEIYTLFMRMPALEILLEAIEDPTHGHAIVDYAMDDHLQHYWKQCVETHYAPCVQRPLLANGTWFQRLVGLLYFTNCLSHRDIGFSVNTLLENQKQVHLLQKAIDYGSHEAWEWWYHLFIQRQPDPSAYRSSPAFQHLLAKVIDKALPYAFTCDSIGFYYISQLMLWIYRHPNVTMFYPPHLWYRKQSIVYAYTCYKVANAYGEKVPIRQETLNHQITQFSRQIREPMPTVFSNIREQADGYFNHYQQKKLCAVHPLFMTFIQGLEESASQSSSQTRQFFFGHFDLIFSYQRQSLEEIYTQLDKRTQAFIDRLFLCMSEHISQSDCQLSAYERCCYLKESLLRYLLDQNSTMINTQDADLKDTLTTLLDSPQWSNSDYNKRVSQFFKTFLLLEQSETAFSNTQFIRTIAELDSSPPESVHKANFSFSS